MSKDHILRLVTFLLVVVGLLAVCPASMASYLSDPSATVTCSVGSADFYKELHGYGNYGAKDHAADILYSGDSGTWNFGSLSGCLPLADYGSATVTFSLVADDHYGEPIGDYSEQIFVNGALVFSGSEPLQHGQPYGTTFTNWEQFSFTTSNLSTPFTVGIENTSQLSGGDWIAIDWIDVNLATAVTPIPEPSSLLLLGTGLLGLAPLGRRWRRK
jgi:hypothetical protein